MLTSWPGDLPAEIASGLRVQRPRAARSIAGFSDGGFCAANLGLQYGRVFSYAGVLSGYFRPYDNQLAGLAQEVSRYDARPQRVSRAPPAAAARKTKHLRLMARRRH